MSGDFISIKIKEVRKETEDAVSILFEHPDEHKEKLQYKPGQYITIKWMDGAKELRRSYSISSVPVSYTHLDVYKRQVQVVLGVILGQLLTDS